MPEMKRTLLIVAAAGLLTLDLAASMDEHGYERVGRYTLQKLLPSPDQVDILSVTVNIDFPVEVDTVGAALDYMLLRSGYTRLPHPSSVDRMSMVLPQVHRRIGPVGLRNAIITVAGAPLIINEDEMSRTIWMTPEGDTDPPDTTRPAAPAEPVTGTMLEEAKPADPLVMPAEIAGHWRLTAGISLRDNLTAWSDHAGWKMEWLVTHDYPITAGALIAADSFSSAVSDVLEFYADAPVPLAATFHSNNVLVIRSARSSAP